MSTSRSTQWRTRAPLPAAYILARLGAAAVHAGGAPSMEEAAVLTAGHREKTAAAVDAAEEGDPAGADLRQDDPAGVRVAEGKEVAHLAAQQAAEGAGHPEGGHQHGGGAVTEADELQPHGRDGHRQPRERAAHALRHEDLERQDAHHELGLLDHLRDDLPPVICTPAAPNPAPATTSMASPATSTAPTISSPSSRIEQSGGQKGKKRKSPYARIPMWKSPLSRMLLSPIIYLPVRSPSVRHRRSPSTMGDIDLNAEPNFSLGHDGPSNKDFSLGQDGSSIDNFSYSQDGPSIEDFSLGQYAPSIEEYSLGQDAPSIEDFSLGQNSHDIEDFSLGQDATVGSSIARRNVVSDEVRRAIFDSLLSRARNGNLSGHETKEVSQQYSVHVRTVQRIWKQGKACLEQQVRVNVSTGRKGRCGRKKTEVDVSTLRTVALKERTTLDDVAKKLGVSKGQFCFLCCYVLISVILFFMLLCVFLCCYVEQSLICCYVKSQLNFASDYI